MNEFTKILRRFFILGIIQILLLKHIEFGWENEIYIKIFIYPLLIILIPLKVNRSLVLLIAFSFGLIIDMFYDSPGLNTASLLIISMLRNLVLRWLEPLDGYKIDSSLTLKNFGFNWFLTYSSILLFINIFFYFSLEAFALEYFSQIIIKTILSFILSEIIIIIYMIILNPR